MKVPYGFAIVVVVLQEVAKIENAQGTKRSTHKNVIEKCRHVQVLFINPGFWTSHFLPKIAIQIIPS